MQHPLQPSLALILAMSRLHSTIIRLLFAASAAAQCSAISAAGKLRNVLRAPGAVVCPGVHDALSTKVFAEAGAQACCSCRASA